MKFKVGETVVIKSFEELTEEIKPDSKDYDKKGFNYSKTLKDIRFRISDIDESEKVTYSLCDSIYNSRVIVLENYIKYPMDSILEMMIGV